MSKKKGNVVAKATFPLYTIQSLSKNMFIIGGGGGTAKTGVPNAFEIYEVSTDNCEVRKLVGVNAEDAVMSCAIIDAANKFDIFCTEGGAWRSYNIQLDKQSAHKIPKKEENEEGANGRNEPQKSDTDEGGLRERRKAGKSAESGAVDGPQNTGEVEGIEHADSDILDRCSDWKVLLTKGKLMSCKFEIEEDKFYHSVLCFSRDNNSVVTGSSDGKIRVWPLIKRVTEPVDARTNGVKIAEINAHEGEINDLALDPRGTKVLSLCRSLDALTLWSFPELKKLATLTWSPGNTLKYKARAVKFGMIEGDRKQARLFTIYNAAVRSSKHPSYLVKWDCPAYVPSKSVVTGKEDLCALAVSREGDYVGVGSLAGSVSIYIAFSLQRLYHVPESHSTFVTGLTFLPQRAGGSYDASLVSVSADSRIKVYNVNKRLMIPFFLVVLLVMACLLLAYFVLDIFHI